MQTVTYYICESCGLQLETEQEARACCADEIPKKQGTISRTNWEKSKDCYECKVSALKRRSNKDKRAIWEANPYRSCGYCTEDKMLETRDGKEECVGCLFNNEKKLCAEQFGGYDKMRCLYRDGKYTKALPIAERILQAIIDDEVNVYEEE